MSDNWRCGAELETNGFTQREAASACSSRAKSQLQSMFISVGIQTNVQRIPIGFPPSMTTVSPVTLSHSAIADDHLRDVISAPSSSKD